MPGKMIDLDFDLLTDVGRMVMRRVEADYPDIGDELGNERLRAWAEEIGIEGDSMIETVVEMAKHTIAHAMHTYEQSDDGDPADAMLRSTQSAIYSAMFFIREVMEGKVQDGS